MAAKLSAWLDRRAARDLYDLWSLSERGLIGSSAVAVFARYGPTGAPLSGRVFDIDLDEAEWHRALGHQTRLRVTAHEAMMTVRQAWLAAQVGPFPSR